MEFFYIKPKSCCTPTLGRRPSVSRVNGPGWAVWGIGAATAALVLAMLTGAPTRAWPVELCSAEAKGLMRQVGVKEEQITRLCKLHRRSSALMTLEILRTANELGYCRVTLALRNNSLEYVNSLALTSAEGHFEIFRFREILPGGTGYASSKSRILLACDELAQIKLVFHWPASMRVADKSPQGTRLNRYKPVLLSPVLGWNR